MKKALTTAAFSFSVLFTFSQKILSDKIDKFDNSRTVYTTEVIGSKIYNITQFSVQGVSVIGPSDTLYRLWFIIKNLPSVTSIDKGHKAILLFSDGGKMELERTGKYQVFSDFMLYDVAIDSEGLEELGMKKVTDIRLETSGAGLTYEIKEKYQDAVPSISRLLVKYIIGK